MVRSTLALIIIVAICMLQSCTFKKAEETCIDNHIPDRTTILCVDGDSTVPWEREDYIPLRFLKIRHLDVNQISQLYGVPWYTESITVRANYKGYLGGDYASLYNSFYNSPDTILQLFVWDIDSIMSLRLYCTKDSNKIYRPAWGYQYNKWTAMFE